MTRRAENYYAVIRWTTDDIIGVAKEHGVVMTEEQAGAWWEANQKWFEDRLIETGNEILGYIQWEEELAK